MQHRVTGRVAHIQTDAIIGLDENQYQRRAHQLEQLGDGRFRVTGPHVSFKYGEIIDIMDGVGGRSSVLEPIGKDQPPPETSDEMRADADDLGIRYGIGIGPDELAARIAKVQGDKIRIEAAADEADVKAKKEANAARRKAAKARK